MKKRNISLFILTLPLLVLSSCNLFKSKTAEEAPDKHVESAVESTKEASVSKAGLSSDVLLTLNGQPAITVDEFEKYLDTMFKAEPQYKQLMSMMPDAEYELFGGLEREAVAQCWLKKQKIDQRADYQNDLKIGMDLVERQIAMNYFQKEYPKIMNVAVTDAEARKIYEEKKEVTPDLVISRGGITAVGVSLGTQAEADAFLAKVKEKGVSFEQTAREKKYNLKDFKNVSTQSFDVENSIREKLLAMKNFPSYELVKSNDKFWVLKGVSKTAPKYVPFDQVKDVIKQQLLMQKLFTEEFDKLKKECNAVENKAYFEKRKAEHQKELEKAQQSAKNKEKKLSQNDKEDLSIPAALPQGSVKGA